MDGFGNINWWGYSPSIDLLENFDFKLFNPENINELNVLLVNAGDQRHILHTIAALKNYSQIKKINFYVYDKMLELYARDFLLISLACEHPSRRGLQEKTELFLDIYGNLFTREFTSNYIETKSNEFIKYITDLDYLQKTNLNIFDFSQLKYKERDFLENIFKFWRLKLKQPDQYPVDKCWDYRLRTYFGVRYDTRSNSYDWDFSMKLIDRPNTAIINNKIYSRWRETGIAFDLRDSSYDAANKTLASGMIFQDPRQNGDKTSRRGYFGDIILGPYITYGIESINKELFKKQNEIYMHTATEVARDNVGSYLSAILEQNGFDLKKLNKTTTTTNLAKEMSSLKIEEIIEEDEEDEENKKDTKLNEIDEYIKIENFKICFLPLTCIQDFNQKNKYDSFFHIAYFSNSGSVHLNNSIKKILKPNGLVILETAKFMIEMNNQQIKTFSDRLKQIAEENKLICLNELNEEGKQDENKVKLENKNHYYFKN